LHPGSIPGEASTIAISLRQDRRADDFKMADRNLILIHRGHEYLRDFNEIASHICAIDPATAVFVSDQRTARMMSDLDWLRPTLTVAFLAKFKAEIRRGPVLRNRQMHKPAQHRIFAEAGLPYPASVPFVPGTRLDPIMFGEFVVLKPIDPSYASYGRGVQLFRRRKLETMTLADFPPDHRIHRDRRGFIVQRFIDIGRQIPINRVLTLFGVPLYCWVAREKVALPPITGTDAEIEQMRISNAGSFRERILHADADVLQLGCRVGEAFPDVPLLGMDILREEKTGKLFVLETNPGGNTWHFSSKETAGVRRQLGGASLVGEKKGELVGRQMLIDQFGALERAAEVLARKARELAA